MKADSFLSTCLQKKSKQESQKYALQKQQPGTTDDGNENKNIRVPEHYYTYEDPCWHTTLPKSIRASNSKQSSSEKHQLCYSVCIFLAIMSSQSKVCNISVIFRWVQWQLSKNNMYVRSHTISGQTKPVQAPNCKVINFVSLQRRISNPSPLLTLIVSLQ